MKTVSATTFYLDIITEMRNINYKIIFTCPSKCISNHHKDRYCIHTEEEKEQYFSSQFGGVFMSMLISYTWGDSHIISYTHSHIILTFSYHTLELWLRFSQTFMIGLFLGNMEPLDLLSRGFVSSVFLELLEQNRHVC